MNNSVYAKIETRLLFLLGLLFLTIVLLLLKPVLMPFIVAFVLAYLLDPLVEKLSHYKLNRPMAILLVFAVVGVSLTVGIAFLVPVIWEQIMYAKDHLPQASYWVNHTASPWLQHTLHIDPKYLRFQALADTILQFFQNNYSLQSTQDVLMRVAESGLGLVSFLGLAVLTPMVMFYFLLDWKNIMSKIRRLLPRSIEPKVIQITKECDGVMRAFVKGQFLVMFILAIVYAVGLQIIGLKVGIIIGLIAGIFSIVPYLGFVIGFVASIFAVLFQFGFDWLHITLVCTVFAIANVLEGYVLQPFLLGDKIGLSPVAVIFAVLAGGHLGGIVGMLLALPISAILLVLLRHSLAAYYQSNLYLMMPKNVRITLKADNAE